MKNSWSSSESLSSCRRSPCNPSEVREASIKVKEPNFWHNCETGDKAEVVVVVVSFTSWSKTVSGTLSRSYMILWEANANFRLVNGSKSLEYQDKSNLNSSSIPNVHYAS